MPRQILAASSIHPLIDDKIGGRHTTIVKNLQQAIANNHIVVVGMAQNPYCKKVRKNLTAAGLACHYLEYGSYFKQWSQRLSIKLWSGWSTFPMVFVDGILIGGNSEVEAMLASGELKASSL
jgi:monothiol glutaredoxin